MEVTLSQLAERWNNVVWGMDPYKGGDVPLLKIAEEDFEALEVLVTCIRQKKRYNLHLNCTSLDFVLSCWWAR